MHLFSDASFAAYGVSAYIVSEGTSRLLMAKANVASIKPLTIPKLELTAVLLAACLARFILEAYANEFEVQQLYLWFDSQITLYWLSSSTVRYCRSMSKIGRMKYTVILSP